MRKSPSINLFTVTLLLTLLLTGLGPASPPPVRAQSGFDCGDVTEIPYSECEALVALYDATDGDNWGQNTKWLQTNTPCSWYGVACRAGSVGKLMLSRNNLTGTIAPEIGSLTELVEVRLSGNHLTGPIPSEISALTNLITLNLSRNELDDDIPAELGYLTALQLLHLDHNQLSGPIPAELGNLMGLIFLWLEHNQLSGSIPAELGNLSELRYLVAEYNHLSGQIPRELGGA